MRSSVKPTGAGCSLWAPCDRLSAQLRRAPETLGRVAGALRRARTGEVQQEAGCVVVWLWQHVGSIFCYRRERQEGCLDPRSSRIGHAPRKARRWRRFALRAGLMIHAPATIAKAKTPGMTASQLLAAANAPAPPQLNEDRASAKVA